MTTDPRVGRVIELVEAIRKCKEIFGQRVWGDIPDQFIGGYRRAFDALEHDDLSTLGELPEKAQRVVDAARQVCGYWNVHSEFDSHHEYNRLRDSVRALDAPQPKVWMAGDEDKILRSDGAWIEMSRADLVPGALVRGGWNEARTMLLAALNLYEREQAKKP